MRAVFSKNLNTISFAILATLVLLSIVTALEHHVHYLGRHYDSLVLDNVNHYLPCDELPKIEEVEKVVQEHRDIVEKIVKDVGRIEQGIEVIPLWQKNMVSDGENSQIVFGWGGGRDCPGIGRGGIEILYPNHRDRIIIERILNDGTFFGIPVTLVNV